MQPGDKDIRVTVTLTAEEHTEVKLHSVRMRTTMAELGRLALLSHVRERAALVPGPRYVEPSEPVTAKSSPAVDDLSTDDILRGAGIKVEGE